MNLQKKPRNKEKSKEKKKEKMILNILKIIKLKWKD